MQEIVELTLVILLLVLSYIFSGSEVSLLSLSDLDRLKLARNKNRKNLLIIKYLRTPETTLITILIGNTVVNASAAIIGEELSRTFFIHNALLYSVFIMTFLVLLFGEIVPKNFAAARPVTFSRSFINVINITNKIFYPFITFMSRLVKRSSDLKKKMNLSKDELLSAVETSAEAGLDTFSINILKNMIHLIEKPIIDIMVPRSKIEGLEIADSWNNMERFIKKSPYSAVLFFQGNIDYILGYLMVTDLLEVKKKDIRSALRKPLYIPESKPILSLLSDFKERKNHIAIVLDEYGGTSGLVTLKDILDSIFIKDILLKGFIRKKGEGVWVVHGNTKIADLNSTLNTDLPGEPNTASGYVINLIGTIPEAGTELHILKNFKITIIDSDNKQIGHMEFTKLDI